MPFYHIFSNGGFKQGGLNFDAKIRRQSIDPEDLFYAILAVWMLLHDH